MNILLRLVDLVGGPARLAVGLLFGSLLALTGCQNPLPKETFLGPSYVPSNVFSAEAKLPRELRRVAILPIAAPADAYQTEAHRRELQNLLHEGFSKSLKFEAISVSQDSLREWCGRRSLKAEEALPEGVLKRIREVTGCDGVLFATVHVYRPYPPVAIGWRLKLVQITNEQTVWSVDEVLDSAQPEVANGAQRYYASHRNLPANLSDSRSILSSPDRFTEYSVSLLVSTLPPR